MPATCSRMTHPSSESLRSGLHSGAKSNGEEVAQVRAADPAAQQAVASGRRRLAAGSSGRIILAPQTYSNFSFLRAIPQTALNPLRSKIAELGSGTTWTVSIPELKGFPEMYVAQTGRG